MNKIAPMALIVLCLGILAWAGLRANAAWHFYAAQTVAEPLFETDRGNEAVFEEAGTHLEKALQAFPANPDYLDFAGRLTLLQATQPGVLGAGRRALLEDAADNFRQALRTRPLWPYSWANLLAAKDGLGQVDLEFKQAMNRCAELGPWEPGVQLRVVNAGLRNWERLASSERAVVRQKALDAMKMRPRELFATVRDYGRPDLVCDAEEVHAQIRRWCAEVLPLATG